MSENKLLVFIPTYNERENIGLMYSQIKTLDLGCDILFMDDNSPDGSGAIIDGLTRQDKDVYAVHRPAKLGIGSAHMEGIRWAYAQGYDELVTMDCDFSHSPKYLKRFLSEGEGFDVVVGSRYRKKKSLSRWTFFRKLLTHLGHFLTSVLLDMPYDATGAFRLYRLKQIPLGLFEMVSSQSYSFLFESLYLLQRNKHSIKEVSIYLPTRTYGHSKMRLADASQSLFQLFRLWYKRVFDPRSLKYRGPALEQVKVFANSQQAQWDAYWTAKKNSGFALYDLIAVFYRKFIIKGILNHFTRKHFPFGARVLHAGCGSGQVDEDLIGRLRISALDISAPALDWYKRQYGSSCEVIQASIFDIPVPDGTFDGVYNLGVMEHFSAQEIEKILREFKRVIKPSGRIILFWPPEFGLSVRFLKGVHFVLNKLLKKNIQLHPEEITRLQSREHALAICSKAGFSVVDYYFGARDLFTYCVVALAKDNA